MIREVMSLDMRRVGFLDFFLTAISASLATYSMGQGMGSEQIGLFFVGFIFLGTICSYLVARLSGDSPVIKFDGYLYAFLGLGALFFVRDLNNLLPENLFDPQLLVAAVLAWMLLLGSFVTWRDGTLLFQAIPSVALFGLVGIWDTYKPSTFLFFGFLLCLATMFARAHARAMLKQVEDSGFMDSKKMSGTPEARVKAVREGPWRWMAGPEWALASAGAIVLISVIGAPIIQESVKPIAGLVRIYAKPQKASGPSLLQTSSEGSVRIGQGPSTLAATPVIRATLDEPRYLRSVTFGFYTGRGWQTVQRVADAAPGTPRPASLQAIALEEISHPQTIHFKIELLPGAGNALPVPGEVVEIEGNGQLTPQTDGTMQVNSPNSLPPVSGAAVVAIADGRVPTEAARDHPVLRQQAFDTSNISPEVRDLAVQVTKGQKTDYQKAIAIQREIERRDTYNLNAAASPVDADPVKNFLFDHREGYCDLFASSMALMARSVNIPARYVTGYFPVSGTKDQEGRYIIKESEAHAWAELFFKGRGWVVFDATEGAQQAEGGAVGQTTGAWYREPLFWISIGAVLLFLMAFWIFGRTKADPKTKPVKTLRPELGKAYAGFESTVRRATGKRRQPSQTPDEYLRSTSRELGLGVDTARDLNDQFVAALYSPIEVDPALLKTLRHKVKELKKELRQKGVSRRRFRADRHRVV